MTGGWRRAWRLLPDTTEVREEAGLVRAAPGTECDGEVTMRNVRTLTLETLWCGHCLEPGLVTLVQPGQLQPRLGPGGADQGHITGTEGGQVTIVWMVSVKLERVLVCQCDVM